MIRMLDPTGVDERRETRMAERDGVLRGKRLGLLANGKTNAVALLEMVGALLVERHGLAPPVLRLVPPPTPCWRSCCPGAIWW
jgi:hypothetical protein